MGEIGGECLDPCINLFAIKNTSKVRKCHFRFLAQARCWRIKLLSFKSATSIARSLITWAWWWSSWFCCWMTYCCNWKNGICASASDASHLEWTLEGAMPAERVVARLYVEIWSCTRGRERLCPRITFSIDREKKLKTRGSRSLIVNTKAWQRRERIPCDGCGSWLWYQLICNERIKTKMNLIFRTKNL